MKKWVKIVLLMSIILPVSGCQDEADNAQPSKNNTEQSTVKKSGYEDLINKAEHHFAKEEYDKSISAYQKALNEGGAKDQRIEKNINGIKTLQEVLELKKNSKSSEIKTKIAESKVLEDPENIAFDKLKNLNEESEQKTITSSETTEKLVQESSSNETARQQTAANQETDQTENQSQSNLLINSEQEALNLVNSKRTNAVAVKNSEGFDGTNYRFTFLEQGEEFRAVVNAATGGIVFEEINSSNNQAIDWEQIARDKVASSYPEYEIAYFRPSGENMDIFLKDKETGIVHTHAAATINTRTGEAGGFKQ